MSLLVVVAGLASMSVALLVFRGPPSSMSGSTKRIWRVAPLAVAVPVVWGLLSGWGPRALVLTVVAGSVVAVGGSLIRSRAKQGVANAAAAQVLEACEAIAAELAAGQPPGRVLERGAAEWPLLIPVAESFRVGADVPQAWRSAAERPGAEDLRLVAAAWQVAHRTGAGLAATLDQIVVDLRAARATRRVVDGELASARSTAKLIAVLPVLALSMGSGAGGDPWAFLIGEPLGVACLALGLACGATGLAWIEALARGVDRG